MSMPEDDFTWILDPLLEQCACGRPICDTRVRVYVTVALYVTRAQSEQHMLMLPCM